MKRIDLLVRTLPEPGKLAADERRVLLSQDAKMRVTGVTIMVEQMDAMGLHSDDFKRF